MEGGREGGRESVVVFKLHVQCKTKSFGQSMR